MDITKTLKNLVNNNMDAYHLTSSDKVIPLLDILLSDSKTVSVGGSVTLSELNIPEYLRCSNLEFFDRYKDGLTRPEIEHIFRQSFFADSYIMSSNAVTENGELYNVDGNGNRIAALAFGPKNVIVIVGKNKIVRDIDEAVKRVKTVAAPKNCARLEKDTFCQKTGSCIFSEGKIGSGCKGDSICSSFIVTGYQQKKGRIKVIIVDEHLGY